MASVKPVGPAPTMRTCASMRLTQFTGANACPIQQSDQMMSYQIGLTSSHPAVPARGTPRRSRRGAPVAGAHNHRRWNMGPRFRGDDSGLCEVEPKSRIVVTWLVPFLQAA